MCARHKAWARPRFDPALGQQRLMRQMSAPEGSLKLTRLAQHPIAVVQQFVTQWLLGLARRACEVRCVAYAKTGSTASQLVQARPTVVCDAARVMASG